MLQTLRPSQNPSRPPLHLLTVGAAKRCQSQIKQLSRTHTSKASHSGSQTGGQQIQKQEGRQPGAADSRHHDTHIERLIGRQAAGQLSDRWPDKQTKGHTHTHTHTGGALMGFLRLFLSLPPGITWNLLAAFSEAGRWCIVLKRLVSGRARLRSRLQPELLTTREEWQRHVNEQRLLPSVVPQARTVSCSRAPGDTRHSVIPHGSQELQAPRRRSP